MLSGIRGIVFDMDGTLCLPQTYMFKEMRSALGIDKSVDILDHVHGLPEPAQEEAQEKLRVIERRAMQDMEPQPGLHELMTWLARRDIRTTICTRNFPIPVEYLRTKFLEGITMEPVITREFRPPKPAPDGILKIAQAWGLEPRQMVMVGDSIDDMHAGRRAGVATVLLRNDVNQDLTNHEATDYVIDSLPELIGLLTK